MPFFNDILQKNRVMLFPVPVQNKSRDFLGVVIINCDWQANGLAIASGRNWINAKQHSFKHGLINSL